MTISNTKTLHWHTAALAVALFGINTGILASSFQHIPGASAGFVQGTMFGYGGFFESTWPLRKLETPLPIGLGILYGSDDVANSETTSDSFSELNKAKLSIVSSSVYSRWAFTPSLAIKWGMGFRKIFSRFIVTNRVTGESIDASFSNSSLTLDFGLVSQWTVSQKYFVSIDWFGIQYPFHTYMRTNTTVSGDIDSQNRESLQGDVDDLNEDLAQTTSLKILIASVGIIF